MHARPGQPMSAAEPFRDISPCEPLHSSVRDVKPRPLRDPWCNLARRAPRRPIISIHNSIKRRLGETADVRPLVRPSWRPAVGADWPRRLTPANEVDRTDVVVTRGSENPIDAEVCVIVMAVDADPNAPAAVRSVINQPIAAEIVLVNTGTGSFASLLPPQMMRRITLVESAGRRFAGGTRNLGIENSKAPIVAFLAADCLAQPDWLQARMDAHKSGHDLVSSSIKPSADQSGSISSASWASYVLIHSHRAPRATFGPKSLFFGLSYIRETARTGGWIRRVASRLRGSRVESKAPGQRLSPAVGPRSGHAASLPD